MYEEWWDKISSTAAVAAARSGDLRSNIGQALVDLNDIVLAAPALVQDAYVRLSEEALHHGSARNLDRVLNGEQVLTTPSNLDAGLAALLSGALLRALDEAHLLLAPTLGPPAAPMRDWLTRDETHFLIPRPFGRGFRKPPAKGQSVGKRGLLNHVALPRRLCGLRVEIASVDALLPSGDELNAVGFGAALMSDFSVTLAEFPGPRFLVSDVAFSQGADLLMAQVNQALDARCHFLVWPELSVSELHQNAIERALASSALLKESPLQLVIAGTRHVAARGGTVNRARILLGTGEPVSAYYDKLKPFVAKTGAEEGIVPGESVLILVTELGLASIGICKDFCDEAATNVFEALPVDVFLVPSLGNDQTMKGHQDVAKWISVRHGAVTFVVQQDIPQDLEPHAAPAGMLGYVLPPSGDPRASELPALAQTGTFSLHTVRTSR